MAAKPQGRERESARKRERERQQQQHKVYACFGVNKSQPQLVQLSVNVGECVTVCVTM